MRNKWKQLIFDANAGLPFSELQFADDLLPTVMHLAVGNFWSFSALGSMTNPTDLVEHMHEDASIQSSSLTR